MALQVVLFCVDCASNLVIVIYSCHVYVCRLCAADIRHRAGVAPQPPVRAAQVTEHRQARRQRHEHHAHW